MARYLRLFSACASFLTVLSFQSCSPLKSFSRTAETEVLKTALYPPFSNPELQKFDLSIDVMGKYFNGMLLVKQLSDTTFRTVFTSYAGPTLFDMFFSPSGHRVDQCMDELNKKRTLQLFATTFSTLFLTSVDSVQPGRSYVSDVDPSGMFYRLSVSGKKVDFRTDTRQRVLTDIRSPGFSFQLSDHKEVAVGTISVRYKSIVRVLLTLKRLN